jgi:RNA polymerase sigma factor (sigma-70 family)
MDLPQLLAAVRAGSAEARNELVRRYQPRVAGLVHHHIRTRLRPQQHAVLRLLSTGDIVQEVFVEVLRGLDRWDGEAEEPFVALLATLVEHRLLDQVRRSQAGRRDVRREHGSVPDTIGIADDDRGPATLAMSREQVDIYRDVLTTFAERERALLTLRLEDACEFEEIAGRLAYPSGDAARKAFHATQARLLLRLRQRGVAAQGTNG